MFAVRIATPMKTITEYRDVLESEANPLIP
jgi:hypothetical protein